MQGLVVIPTYNEKEALPPTLERIFTIMPELQVLIVDDDSPDGTWAWVKHTIHEKRYGDRLHLLHRTQERGFASAYRAGFDYFLQGHWEYIQLMDADGSHPIEVLPQFRRQLEAGAEIVVGSRYVAGGGYRDWPRQRVILSAWGQRYTRFWLGTYFHDWTSGFVAMKRELLAGLDYHDTKAQGFALLMELKALATQHTHRMEEVPIVFVNRELGESKLNRRIIVEGLRLPVLLRFQRILEKLPMIND